MNFIKAIADKQADDFAHWCFIRYGLGEYEKEPLVITKTSSKVKLKGGFEYVNAFHGFMASLANEHVALKGNIVTSKDVADKLAGLGIVPEAVEKLRGKSAFKYVLDTMVDADTYMKLFHEVNDCFMLFNAEDSSGRKVNVKSEKPPKIGSPKPGFARLELPGSDFSKVKQEFLWDVKREGRKYEITHTYIINDIEIPKQYENDPLLARQKAIRKGEIKRVVALDDQPEESTIPLEA